MKKILIAATTINGHIARNNHELVKTSKEDKLQFMDKTKHAGVVIMGWNTFKTFKNPLPDRLNVVIYEGEIEEMNDENVLYTNESPEEIIAMLEEKGYETVYIIGGMKTYTLFLNHKLIDFLDITIEPTLFQEGLPLFGKLESEYMCRLLNFNKLNDNTINFLYEVIYR